MKFEPEKMFFAAGAARLSMFPGREKFSHLIVSMCCALDLRGENFN